jgi:hypothetical protein
MASRCVAFAFVICIAVSGCVPYNSISSTPFAVKAPVAPALKKQSDLSVTGGFSPSTGTLDAAYAITNHSALILSTSLAIDTESRLKGNQWDGELGFGFFDTSAHHLTRGVFAATGYGFANYSMNYYWSNLIMERAKVAANQDVRFLHTWVQADQGFGNRFVSFILIIRLTYIHILRDHNAGESWGEFGAPPYSTFDQTKTDNIFLLTPAVHLSVGTERLKLTAGLNLMIGLSKVNRNDYPLLPSFGIGYTF